MMLLKQLPRRSLSSFLLKIKIELTSPKEIVLTAGGSQLHSDSYYIYTANHQGKIDSIGLFSKDYISCYED